MITLKESRQAGDAVYLEAVLRETNGHVATAAVVAGVSVDYLYTLIKRLGLTVVRNYGV